MIDKGVVLFKHLFANMDTQYRAAADSCGLTSRLFRSLQLYIFDDDNYPRPNSLFSIFAI